MSARPSSVLLLPLALLLGLTLPAVLRAQDSPLPDSARLAADAPQDPIELLFANRKELVLADSQVVRLRVIQDSLRVRNAPLLRRLAEAEGQAAEGPRWATRRGRMVAEFGTREEIRKNDERAWKAARKLLSDWQRKLADRLRREQLKRDERLSGSDRPGWFPRPVP
ncbi:MAG TPA: hypothetical protein VFQ38_09045 [Longimicrobiales bacterium]|nr:hypothetical protein [Longimicrobiales bacterium]